jgi:hypothetical protein
MIRATLSSRALVANARFTLRQQFGIDRSRRGVTVARTA